MGCSSCIASYNGQPKGCKNNGICGADSCNKRTVFDWLTNMKSSDSESLFDWIELEKEQALNIIDLNEKGEKVICIEDYKKNLKSKMSSDNVANQDSFRQIRYCLNV